jgi:hypothetical protein
MRVKDLIIGETYRHKDNPKIGYAKVVRILKPKEDINPHNRIIVKCEWTYSKNADIGLIKYFNPRDLEKE